MGHCISLAKGKPSSVARNDRENWWIIESGAAHIAGSFLAASVLDLPRALAWPTAANIRGAPIRRAFSPR